MSLIERYKDALRISKGLTIVLTIIVAFFLLALASSVVNAGTTTLINCTPPTARTDGQPLSAAEIQGYRWYINGQQEGTTTDCQPGTVIVTSQPDGSYTLEASTIDVNGLESITMSSPITKSFTTAPPNPPSGVQ